MAARPGGTATILARRVAPPHARTPLVTAPTGVMTTGHIVSQVDPSLISHVDRGALAKAALKITLLVAVVGLLVAMAIVCPAACLLVTGALVVIAIAEHGIRSSRGSEDSSVISGLTEAFIDVHQAKQVLKKNKAIQNSSSPAHMWLNNFEKSTQVGSTALDWANALNAKFPQGHPNRAQMLAFSHAKAIQNRTSRITGEIKPLFPVWRQTHNHLIS